MTELLDRAVRTARTLPAELQDEIARAMLMLASASEPVYVMSADEEASLDLARAQVAKGEFASDDQMRAIWAKHGL